MRDERRHYALACAAPDVREARNLGNPSSRTSGAPNKGFGRTATGVGAAAEPSLPTRIFRDAERGGRRERCGRETRGRPNGSDVKLRGQGPRGYGRGARRPPACGARGGGGGAAGRVRR